MGGLLSKSKSSRITQEDKAILDLKVQRDQLKVYKKKIGLQLDKDRELAKKLLAQGNKERAKLMLKKKRYQDQLLDKTEKQLDLIDQMVNDIEFAQVQNRVLEGLKEGNEALKRIQNIFTLSDVEKILEESQDAISKQNEIDELLSGVLSDEDEEAVEQELQDILGDMKTPEEGSLDLHLPSVPSEEPQEKKKHRARKQQVLESS